MLDPLTALTVAASVVQFVDFSIKLVSDGVELYHHGTLANNNELEQATKDLTYLTEELASTPQVAQYQPGFVTRLPSKDEIALKELAGSCKELGDQLLCALEDLKAKKSQNGLESFRKAIKNAKRKDKLRNMETRLKKLQDQLSVRLLAILDDKHSKVMSMLKDISEECQRSEINTSDKIDNLRLEMVNAIRNQRNPHQIQYQRNQVVDRKGVFSDIGTICLELAEESNRIATSQRVLNSLYFKSIKVRQADIKEAHARTFEWIFVDNSGSAKPQARFLDWMKSGTGIYWISGKAGSGKSTLVKFLCDHERTYSALQRWAGKKEIVIATYFFWSAGNTMQKSQEGLLQSLLYQVLRQCPHLIPIICPSRWKETALISGPDLWTYPELSQAINSLAKQDDLSAKFCFFVDGLDEYNGEHIDIIHILQSFANSPSFKLCVSSRPWNVFVEAFGGNLEQKFVLQDFTKEDIRLYAKNKLQEDTRFLRLMNQDHRCQSLIEDIVERSAGVFLWVYLVVRSLLRGLTDDNDVDTLQLRLDHLPADLENYFKQILETIEDVYQKQTAQIFLLTVHAISPLSAIALSLLEKEKEDPEFALEAKIQPFPDTELISIHEKMRKHLNARCKDLLEINTDMAEGTNFLRYRVNFLHRTVRDFLTTQYIYDLLQSRAPAKFDVRLSLCRILLRQIKAFAPAECQPSADGSPTSLDSLVHEMIYYAHEIETYNELPEIALLDELNRVLLVYADSSQSHMTLTSRLLEHYSTEKFIATLTEAGLHLYVAQRLDNQPRFLSQVHELPLLSHALQHPTAQLQNTVLGGLNREFDVDIDMLRVLLERGANPNEKVRRAKIYAGPSYTIWEEFLRHCFVKRKEYGSGSPKQLYEAVEMFLRHGADPDLDCETHQTEQHHQRRGKLGRVRSVTVVERHYAKPATILKAVMRPSQYEQIALLLVENRAAKRSSRSSGIWKWAGVK